MESLIGRKCIVRTQNAGVFAAVVQSLDGTNATLTNSRRIWYWSGAASLSELATRGTSNPSACKFPCEIAEHYVTEVIEVIPMTDAAKESIDNVPEWTQHGSK